ncbi:hypothetical protein [Streptomyces sp. ODS28]|uniref:hypothetical protein n=1 Tax=Streptomyces sp. ODS28 TaxID=3136688 RepID=UPI0031E7B584
MGEGNKGQGGEGQANDWRAAQQSLATEQRHATERRGPLGGATGDPGLGKTSFEGRELNEMIDLLEGVKPHELMNVGEDLADAAKAMRRAATELKRNSEHIEWEGESGSAFRDWTRGLVKNTHSLADFAEDASTQMKSAGDGLSEAKRSMPGKEGGGSRDAKREEAVNQLTRLRSYYQVSHDNMSKSQPPTFAAMPNIGMPPAPKGEDTPPSRGGGGAVGGGSDASSGGGVPGSPSQHGPSGPTPAPGDDRVGTGLDSVAPPAPPADPTPHSPAPAQPNPSGGGQPNVPGPSMVNPLARQPQVKGPTATGGRTGPSPAGRPPAGQQTGRPGATGKTPPVGRPGTAGQNQPVGRQGTNQPVGRSGTSGQPTGRTGQSPMGRTGGQGQQIGRPTTTGQQGMTGRTASTPGTAKQGPNAVGRNTGIMGRPTGTSSGAGTQGGRSTSGPQPGRSGRSDGVVGGTPSRNSGSSQQNSSRLPRGNVIGNQQPSAGQAPGGFKPRGSVIGADSAAANESATQRPTGAGAGGVVGTPRPAGTASGGSDRQFSAGGSGLVRGNQPQDRDEERQENERPAHVTEEETRTSGRRRTVPPVIE